MGQRGSSKSWGLLFFLRKIKIKSSIGNRFFASYIIISVVKTLGFVTDFFLRRVGA